MSALLFVLLAATLGAALAAGRSGVDLRHFAKEQGLSLAAKSKLVGTRRGCRVLIELADVAAVSVTVFSGRLPEHFAFGWAEDLTGEAWPIGDPALDVWPPLRAGDRAFAAFALSPPVRQVLHGLRGGSAFVVGAGGAALRVRFFTLEQLARHLDLVIDVVDRWSVDPAAALADRTHDPLPAVRAAAIVALARADARVFDERVPQLREDKEPVVQLAVALATQTSADLARVFAAALPEAELPAYLALAAAKGNQETMPALHQLESARQLRTETQRAFDRAVAAIRHRFGSAEDGALSSPADDRGGLSKPRDDE